MSLPSTSNCPNRDATDVESYAIPSSPTPAPRNAQRGAPIHLATLSLAPQPDSFVSPNDVAFVPSEPQAFGGGCNNTWGTHQNPATDIWNTARTEVQFDLYPSSPYAPAQQWTLPQAPTDVHEQSSPFPASYTSAQPLARTGTDFDLAAKLKELSLQAIALTNSFREYVSYLASAMIDSG